MKPDRRLLLPSLAAVTGIMAVVLGVLMSLGGAALAVAVLSTPQAWPQIVTAAIFILAGLVNVRSGIAIRRGEARWFALSGLATATLMLYLGAGLNDFGEPFWMHAAYLIVLLAAAYRTRVRLSIAR
jgi:hypothetical protein